MEKSFKNSAHNKIRLTFPNGNSISTIWSRGSYTDNFNLNEDLPLHNAYETFADSMEVEVMIDCSDKLYGKICRKLDARKDDGVIGHLSIEQWLWTLNQISK